VSKRPQLDRVRRALLTGPLPDRGHLMSIHVELVVRETVSRGRGVFAGAAIPAGTLIESADVIVIPESGLKALDASVLGDYYFRWNEDESQGAIALGYGSLYNHSYEPNARYVKHFDRGTIDFIALRDIAAGEEIRTNYNGDPAGREPVWFAVTD
jgi:SET domain-containing protein